MDIFTLVAGSALAFFLLYVIMRMSYVIMRNVIVGMEFRKNLAQKVYDLRLNRMLEALGIDVNNYLHREPVIDVERHIDKCAMCPNTATCDEQLAADAVTLTGIDFCNNEQALQKIASREPAQGS
jgi:hypothetical protein